MLIVPLSIAGPAGFTLRFVPTSLSVDLSTVTAVNVNVLRRDGTTTTLAMSIVSQTISELIAQYTFVGGELTGTGLYTLSPLLTTQAGVIPSDAVAMFVTSTNGTPQLEQDVWVVVTVPMLTLGPVKATWTQVSAASYSASPVAPWIALDLTGNAITVTLWKANDGDAVVFVDKKNQAGSHALTLNAASGQNVPVGNGTYASSHAYSSGFPLRLKYSAADSAWLSW